MTSTTGSRARLGAGSGLLMLAALAAAAFAPRTAIAQEGSDWAQVAGGALGLYSGAVLGTLGGTVPCSQTLAGVDCVRVSGALGGVVAAIGGVHLGGVDEDAVASAARGAGYGLLIGAAAGFALQRSVQRLGWSEVAAGAIIGSAFGASARGAAIGLAAGTALGTVLYWAVPSFDLPNSIGVAVAGMALGGISSWVIRGVEGHPDAADEGPVVLSFTLSL
ncbi:MAG: hypothetical protein JSW46_20030 [Gemmatimonadota bacterium]|nr:MAG: hypothetical protein JSW46_20030 [Gemmatimonadota bacterium]